VNKVKKGIFITTAKHATHARDFTVNHEKVISLINGDQLCDLMILHGVGVSEVKIFKVSQVDNDYFSSNV